MMGDVRDLYQAMILDHGKRPRNLRRMEAASSTAEGFNPLCGDRVTVFVRLEGGVLRDLSFEGQGCAICTASASMMTERLKGCTLADTEEVWARFHDLVVSGPRQGEDRRLGKLEVFEGVRAFPVRIKCATLAWHTLLRALHPSGDGGRREAVPE